MSHRDKKVCFIAQKLKNVRDLFYYSYNDKLHVNFYEAEFYIVLFHTDNMFEKLSKCINDLPLSPPQEVLRYFKKLAL